MVTAGHEGVAVVVSCLGTRNQVQLLDVTLRRGRKEKQLFGSSEVKLVRYFLKSVRESNRLTESILPIKKITFFTHSEVLVLEELLADEDDSGVGDVRGRVSGQQLVGGSLAVHEEGDAVSLHA